MMIPEALANMPPAVLKQAHGIKLLALDVDGVMTNGTLYFGHSGEQLKGFSILDGLGIKLLQRAGITVAIITGRQSEIVSRRAAELGITHITQSREDKITALNELLAELQLSLNDAAYIGDDLPDLAAIKACRLGVAVNSAYSLIKQHADWVCSKRGGEGAVREVADIILYANGQYKNAMENYL